jgi:hypothetical protein
LKTWECKKVKTDQLPQSLSWLPVDLCATAILDLVFPTNDRESCAATDITADPNLVYHILNPQKFSWTADLLPALRKTKLPPFEVVSPEQWIVKLQKSDPDSVKNPSIKLLGFWESKYNSSEVKDINGEREGDRTGINGEAGNKTNGVADEDTNGLLFEMDRTIAACPALGKVPDLIRSGYIGTFVDDWLKRWNI